MKFKTQAHKISFDYQNHFHKDMCKHTRARWSCLLNMSIFVLKRATTEKMPQSRAGSMEGSTEGCLLPQVVFHWRLSSNKGCLPIKVIFHWRSSSTEGCLPLKVVLWQKDVFHRGSSYTEGCLPPKVFFHWRSSSTEGCLPTEGRLPMKVVFHRTLSSTEGCWNVRARVYDSCACLQLVHTHLCTDLYENLVASQLLSYEHMFQIF